MFKRELVERVIRVEEAEKKGGEGKKQELEREESGVFKRLASG